MIRIMKMYSILYRILPRGYRVWASPAELYDAMIYVSDAHPIEVIEDQKKIDKLPFGYHDASGRVVTNADMEVKIDEVFKMW